MLEYEQGATSDERFEERSLRFFTKNSHSKIINSDVRPNNNNVKIIEIEIIENRIFKKLVYC